MNKHLLNHTKREKKTLSREALEEMCKSYQSEFGIFTDRELMGIARHHNYINVAWIQKISKSQDEFLAILCLVQEGNKYLVDRCWVDLWQPKANKKVTTRPLPGNLLPISFVYDTISTMLKPLLCIVMCHLKKRVF